MTERSRPWDGTTTGDATEAPYDAATEFARLMATVAHAYDFVAGGVGSELAVTGASSPINVATGDAMVYGTWYNNDANLGVTIPTPAVSTRIDRIVLRKSWASQTIRVTRIAGVEGGAAPAATQSVGVTWDLTIATVSITTGGVVTVTDLRFVAQPVSAYVLESGDTMTGRLDGTTFRSTGQSIPSSGSGAELTFSSSTGFLLAYNRTGGAYIELNVDGNPLRLNKNSASTVQVGTSASASRFTVKQTANTGAGGVRVERSDSTDALHMFIDASSNMFLQMNGAGYIMIRGTDGEIFVNNTGSANQVLHDGRVQRGTSNNGGGGTIGVTMSRGPVQSVTFPSAFGSAPKVFVTVQDSTAGYSGVDNIATTGFDYAVLTDSPVDPANNRTIAWLALI